MLACAVVFGPERIPLDDVTHWEVRVKLCTQYNEPHLIVESRTYERTRTADGGEIRPFGDGDGWRQEKDVRLYITHQEPPK